MKQMTKIQTMEGKNIYFRKWCQLTGLQVGDSYSACDYLAWVGDLTMQQRKNIEKETEE